MRSKIQVNKARYAIAGLKGDSRTEWSQHEVDCKECDGRKSKVQLALTEEMEHAMIVGFETPVVTE